MDTRCLTLRERYKNTQSADLRHTKHLAAAGNIGGARLAGPAGSLARTRCGNKRAQIDVPCRYDPSERRSDLFVSLKRYESIHCASLARTKSFAATMFFSPA